MSSKTVYVEFIGLGYEVTKSYRTTVDSRNEAYDSAEKWYKDTNQTFPYIEMEIKDDRFTDWDK